MGTIYRIVPSWWYICFCLWLVPAVGAADTAVWQQCTNANLVDTLRGVQQVDDSFDVSVITRTALGPTARSLDAASLRSVEEVVRRIMRDEFIENRDWLAGSTVEVRQVRQSSRDPRLHTVFGFVRIPNEPNGSFEGIAYFRGSRCTFVTLQLSVFNLTQWLRNHAQFRQFVR